MQEKHTIIKTHAEEYQKSSKKARTAILDRVVNMTGYHRKTAARLLRHHGRCTFLKPRVRVQGQVGIGGQGGTRRRKYDEQVRAALIQTWQLMDYIASKRLAAVLPEIVPILVRYGELNISRQTQAKLMEMSAATIDRLLEPERQRYKLRGRHNTKPGTLLKHQIAIRTFADWNDDRPGFFQVDLVGHDGGSTRGQYCQTLDLVDVASGWCEQFAVPNKAQCHVFEALQKVRQRLPLKMLGLDSDNGSEFINDQLHRYCVDQEITFTRGRPYQLNDSCHIEQKNWSVVRRFVGYARYETNACVELLNELYEHLRLFVNFFMPNQKLSHKVREGARVKRYYLPAQTPLQRILENPEIDPQVKTHLRAVYHRTNPAALLRRIQAVQKRLRKLEVHRNKHDQDAQSSTGQPAGKSSKTCQQATEPRQQPPRQAALSHRGAHRYNGP